jgi:hypothetical protein
MSARPSVAWSFCLARCTDEPAAPLDGASSRSDAIACALTYGRCNWCRGPVDVVELPLLVAPPSGFPQIGGSAQSDGWGE